VSTALDLARQQYVERQLLARRAVLAAGRLWRQLDPKAIRASWHGQVGPAVTRLLTNAQLEAASTAEEYVSAMLVLQGIEGDPAGTLTPSAFAGVASDGRDLATLLELSNLYALRQIGQGATAAQGLAVGERWLSLAVGTQVLDAGRVANGVAIASRPEVSGYVRMLSPPSCGRCAVLAGRFYRWNQGFQRHPKCDCLNVPAGDQGWARSEGFLDDPRSAIRDGNVTGLSRADTKAIIEDGADVGQVINAHRGMYTADAYGVRVRATTEGVTKRAVAGSRFDSKRSPRLRPESIYAIAKDREDALRLLRRFGYLT
jgi:hypothetical protein